MLNLPPTTDGVLWCTERFFAYATTPQGASEVHNKIADLLMATSNIILRQSYAKLIDTWMANHANAIKNKKAQSLRDIATARKAVLEYNNTLAKAQTELQKQEAKLATAKAKDVDVIKINITSLTTALQNIEQTNNCAQCEQAIQDHSTAVQHLENTHYYYLAEKDLLKLLDVKIADAKAVAAKKQLRAALEYDEDGGVISMGGFDILETLPSFMKKEGMKESIMEHGYCTVTNRDKNTGKPLQYGYYTYNFKDKVEQQATNFTITPLFNVYKGAETTYLIAVDNGYKKVIVSVEAKAFCNAELMQNTIINESNYMVYCGTLAYKRISASIMGLAVRCIEVNKLGWNKRGFWAFTDRVYTPIDNAMAIADENGIVKTSIDEDSYLLASSSSTYKELQKVRDEPEDNNAVMQFMASPIKLTEWVSLMQKVYPEHGLIGAAWAWCCCFRDIIFNIDKNFPLLYNFGPTGSGKSKFSDSLNSFFYHNRPFFATNNGTPPAFFGYVSKFSNGLAGLNEFDTKTIRPEWYQAIKGFYDGEGRQKNSMAKKGEQIIEPISGGVMVIGQYVTTEDDNAITNRCICNRFENVTLRSEEQTESYLKLVAYQQQGLNSLVLDIVKHRAWIEENFKNYAGKTIKNWRLNSIKNPNYNQRIMQNWSLVFTMMQVIKKLENIPDKIVDITAFEELCFKQANYWCNFVRTSDTLSSFWNELQYIIEHNLIIKDWDYKIETHSVVPVRNGNNSLESKSLPTHTKVLFLRLNNVHKIYQENHRRRNGTNGMTLENLINYFATREYYIGSIGKKKFRKPNGEFSTTSAYMFNLDMLDINIDTYTSDQANNESAKEDEVPGYNQDMRTHFDAAPLSKSTDNENTPF